MAVPLDTVNDIRSMDAAGRSRSEIARVPHVSRNTRAKYAGMEDMLPAAPMPQRRGRPALEGNEEWIAGVLEADLGAPRKQRHARRIYDRGGRVASTAVVTAIGCDESGWRRVLVVSDAHGGLVRAIGEVFQGAAWQRCAVHLMRDCMREAAPGS